nr:tetratricopeptide repeat protein [Clostridia bacterium]
YNEVLDDLADVRTGSEFFSSATQTVTENLAVLSYRKGDFGNATDYVKQIVTSENDISLGKTARFRKVASRIVVINTELDRDYEIMSPYLSDYYADYDSCHNLLAARRNELLAGEKPSEADASDESQPYEEPAIYISDAEADDYRLAAVDYYIYITLTALDRDGETLELLEEMHDRAPDAFFFYISPLLKKYVVLAAAGEDGYADKALALCAESEKNNPEDAFPHYGRTQIYRVSGDYEAALAAADAGMEAAPDNYELKRQKAIVYMLQEKYDDALELLKDCFDNDGNITISEAETYALCGAAMGSDEVVEAVTELYSQYGLTLGDAVTAFMNGETTIEEIFLTGECDVA